MKPSLLKELVAIANRLDQKGFGKEADVLDGIIKSAAVGDGSTVERYDRLREMQEKTGPGKIDDGSGYTYDYLRGEDAFIVRTAPPQNWNSIGFKMPSGTRGYEVLKDYVPQDVRDRKLSTIEPIYPERSMVDKEGETEVYKQIRQREIDRLLSDNSLKEMAKFLKRRSGTPLTPDEYDIVVRVLQEEIPSTITTDRKIDRSILADVIRNKFWQLGNPSKSRIIGYFDSAINPTPIPGERSQEVGGAAKTE